MYNKDINIAEILKDCPMGMKLYSPLFGNVELFSVSENNIPIKVRISKGRTYDYYTFTSEGYHYVGYYDAECLLFPSREMRDWSKFFKPGDVAIELCNGCGVLVEEWADDSYTSFKASVFQLKKGGFAKRDKRVISIDGFVKASDEQRDKFIADMEKYFGGKYNPDTLQAEPVKPIWAFKPFDKVLIRDSKKQKWIANYFSFYNEEEKGYPYVCMDGSYRFCIPYEGNEHLLGTTDPYTEGGSK